VAFSGTAAGIAYASLPTETPTPTITPTVTPTASPTPTRAATPTPTKVANPTQGPLNKAIPFEAVVQIYAMFQHRGRLDVAWSGSGTIISADGLILTNAHVVTSDPDFDIDIEELQIGITIAEDRDPRFDYIAEVVESNVNLDLAVLRIVSDVDGDPVDPEDLDLPFVALGNSDSLKLGDPITILGYPGIGGDTITLTRGEVSGFTAESGRGFRAFIKTSASMTGGNSGGLAVDANGLLIGIPTQLGYGGDDVFVDCRILADTNGDGRIDFRDTCVPTGGFINSLRPINLAYPLIEKASNGEIVLPDLEDLVQQENNLLGDLFFSDDFSDLNSGWDVWGDASGGVGYREGGYRVEVTQQNLFVTSLAGKNFSDMVVQVDVRVDKPVGDSDFGVVCRYQDENNFYAVEISEDGFYTIWKRFEGENFSLIDFQHSGFIPTDPGTHQMLVSCVGNTITLYVDGELVAEAVDTSFSSGDLGFIVGTWDHSGVAVVFDDLVVANPAH
jgi:S1-C subfamily serine protease